MNRQNATVVIRASAGTGKTFQLTNRFLSLIKDGVQPDHILAVTFTRLAAGEILERVLLRLSNAALNVDACTRLAAELNDESFTRERCLNLLQELTRMLHRMRVETLDAYFSQLARSFSLEVGLPPNWEILEEVHDRRIRAEALEETIVDDSDRTVSRLIRALFQGEAKRGISQILNDTVRNLYSVLLETDPRAWKNFPELTPLNRDELKLAIEAFKSAEVPKHKRIEEYFAENVEAAETANWEKFVSKGPIKQLLTGETKYYGKEFTPGFVAAAHRIIGHARAVIVNQLKNQTEATFEILKRFDRHYRKLKQRYRGIRFEDVTHSLIGLTESAAPDSQNFRMDAEISHLLLDEFQDTSLRQWQIIRPLAERITGGHRMLFETAWSSFFCVGDVKQAIYGWRGGRSEIFDALEKHLTGIQTLDLNCSYRSAPEIIENVNRVFQRLGCYEKLDSVEPVVREWSNSFPAHQTAFEDREGFVQLETAPLGESDTDWVSADQQLDATFAYAACKIQQLNEDAPDRTIGVLLRRNSSVAHMIYQLRKLGVKASEERGGNPLTDSAAVQVVLSLLTLADHPDDQIAAFHLATSPIAEEIGIDRKLKPRQMVEVSHRIRQQLMEQGYGSTVSGWGELLRPYCNSRDRRRIQQLVELAFRFESIAGIRTGEFLQFVKSERIADPLISNVRVMTVHQSKGLEYDIVVLPELEVEIDDYTHDLVWDAEDPTDNIDRVCVYRNKLIQALLPPEMQRMFQAAKDREAIESLCLLYVALTRAAFALHMIIAPKGKNFRGRSRTYAHLLHHALAEGLEMDEATELFRLGNEQWYLTQPKEDSGKPKPLPLPEKLKLSETTSPVAFDFTSPSTLEGGTRITGANLLTRSDSSALLRGTVIHGLFEQVEWLESLPSDSDLIQVAESLGEGKLDPHTQVQDFRGMLEHEAVAKILAPEFYLEPFDEAVIQSIPDEFRLPEARLEVHNERPFVVPDDGRMLSGTVDRLVLIYSGDQLMAADIIDFKTDRVEADDEAGLAKRAAHYRPQIEAYRRAVSVLFGLEPCRVSARLVFVGPGEAVPFVPSSLPSPVSPA